MEFQTGSKGKVFDGMYANKYFQNIRKQVVFREKSLEYAHFFSRNLMLGLKIPHEFQKEVEQIRAALTKITDASYENLHDRTIVEALETVRGFCSKRPSSALYALISSNALAKIISFLELTSCPELAYESAWILVNLLSGDSAQVYYLLRYGIVDKLLATLSSDRPHLRDIAIWALSNLLGDSPGVRDYVMNKGIMESLLKHASGPLTNEMASNVIWACSNITRFINSPPNWPNHRESGKVLPVAAFFLNHWLMRRWEPLNVSEFRNSGRVMNPYLDTDLDVVLQTNFAQYVQNEEQIERDKYSRTQEDSEILKDTLVTLVYLCSHREGRGEAATCILREYRETFSVLFKCCHLSPNNVVLINILRLVDAVLCSKRNAQAKAVTEELQLLESLQEENPFEKQPQLGAEELEVSSLLWRLPKFEELVLWFVDKCDVRDIEDKLFTVLFKLVKRNPNFTDALLSSSIVGRCVKALYSSKAERKLRPLLLLSQIFICATSEQANLSCTKTLVSAIARTVPGNLTQLSLLGLGLFKVLTLKLGAYVVNGVHPLTGLMDDASLSKVTSTLSSENEKVVEQCKMLLFGYWKGMFNISF